MSAAHASYTSYCPACGRDTEHADGRRGRLPFVVVTFDDDGPHCLRCEADFLAPLTRELIRESAEPLTPVRGRNPSRARKQAELCLFEV